MTPFEDIFGETADDICADEERWQQEFTASREQLSALACEVAV